MSEQTSEILITADKQLTAASSIKHIEEAGKQASILLTEHDAEDKDFGTLDKAMARAHQRIAVATAETGPERKFNRGHYLAPTPRQGERVLFFPRGDQTRAVTADVVAVEDVGKVQLALTMPLQIVGQDRVQGVLHVSHPQHDTANAQTVSQGSWDYLEHTKIPQYAYDRAKKQIEKREDGCRAAALARAAAQREFALNESRVKEGQPQPV